MTSDITVWFILHLMRPVCISHISRSRPDWFMSVDIIFYLCGYYLLSLWIYLLSTAEERLAVTSKERIFLQSFQIVNEICQIKKKKEFIFCQWIVIGSMSEKPSLDSVFHTVSHAKTFFIQEWHGAFERGWTWKLWIQITVQAPSLTENLCLLSSKNLEDIIICCCCFVVSTIFTKQT